MIVYVTFSGVMAHCGNSNLDFRPKFLPPQNCPLYTLYFFEFYNSYVLDLARFEDHTFAFFKGN